MSRGTPIEKRAPIKGLLPGDLRSFVLLTPVMFARDPEQVDETIATAVHTARELASGRPSDLDVLVVVLPRDRRAAVVRALREGL